MWRAYILIPGNFKREMYWDWKIKWEMSDLFQIRDHLVWESILIINWTQTGITWEECLGVGLSRSGMPVGMAIEDCLDYVQWRGQTQSTADSPELHKSREIKLGAGIMHVLSVSALDCDHDVTSGFQFQPLRLPTLVGWKLELGTKRNFFSPWSSFLS